MELSIGVVANKIIVAIICISILIATGGVVFFYVSAAFPVGDGAPFVVGVTLSMLANIAKVIMLKKAITRVMDINSTNSAKAYFQLQYVLRMLFTAGALLLAALLPDNIVSLVGAAAGVFAHPIAMHIVRFFLPKETTVTDPAVLEPTGKGGE